MARFCLKCSTRSRAFHDLCIGVPLRVEEKSVLSRISVKPTGTTGVGTLACLKEVFWRSPTKGTRCHVCAVKYRVPGELFGLGPYSKSGPHLDSAMTLEDALLKEWQPKRQAPSIANMARMEIMVRPFVFFGCRSKE
jgi:hypothetical protein